MLNNDMFLSVIRESFKEYLSIGTSRSTAKLKKLHGSIANDLRELLGSNFGIMSQGYGNDKEGRIKGRYYYKNVDITINYKDKPVAGYAIKFVMRNYSQNSNNYFENMLGETANLRSNSIPYFQIFIVFDKMPHYKNGGRFASYDNIREHNLDKYLILSCDNSNEFYHTPNKTLLILLTLKEKEPNYNFANEEEYNSYYLSIMDEEDLLTYSKKIDADFKYGVIYNDYEDFIERSVHIIKGNLKR